MSGENQNFDVHSQRLNLEQLQQLQQKPPPFAPGEPLFWNDPHISKQMLAAHLDPNTDAASRRPEIIDQSVAWLRQTLDLRPGDTVLDLGCGPGLYAARLAALGLRVSGIDYSQRSIDYASQYAREHNLDISYRYQNYLTLADEGQYEAVLLIGGDFAPFHRNSVPSYFKMSTGPSKQVDTLCWTFPRVRIGSAMALGTPGMLWQAGFGGRGRILCWNKGSIIRRRGYI